MAAAASQMMIQTALQAAWGADGGVCSMHGWREHTHTFVPCGHKCVCEGCALAVMQTASACPTCRGEAREAIHVYS